MADREDNVYKAKLAEQAERYDGMLSDIPVRLFFASPHPLIGRRIVWPVVYSNFVCGCLPV